MTSEATRLRRPTLAGRATDRRLLLWLAAALFLGTTLTLLTISIKDDPFPSQDLSVLDSISGWDVPALAGFFSFVSFLTNAQQALIIGALAVAFLWLIGMNRAAFAFAIVGAIIGVVAILGDFTLGEFIGRTRPEAATSTHVSYPSGHVFGGTVFFGFWAFLAIYYRVNRAVLVPLLVLLFGLISTVGLARIFQEAHWPSDVAAGYLLGGIWLLLLIPFFLWIQKLSWIARLDQEVDPAILGCETCRIEHSIASTVVLDPEHGTATKTYNPPGLVRLLYWLAFQARFPYEGKEISLHAGEYRRKIASYLTRHRFGKDLVSPVIAMDCMHGNCSFVTEFVAGDKVENDDEAKEFLGQVAQTFADAGLGVWQINPRNPHAHTNLIRNADGDMIIIDLESAVVTPFPAPGQWRSALRLGTIPVFDDIDFGRLRAWANENVSALQTSLGRDGLAEFQDAIDQGEEVIRAWKDGELRIWGRLSSGLYRLFNWKAYFEHVRHALDGAPGAARHFVERGLKRWEAEGKIDAAEAATLRAQIASPEARSPLRHMGAHMILSEAIAIPIPGLRSAARFSWTLLFWIKGWVERLLRRTAAKGRVNIHTPLVMMIALVPAFGAVSYLAARPLRRGRLFRVIFDQAALKLPFKLYTRLRFDRWLGVPGTARRPEA